MRWPDPAVAEVDPAISSCIAEACSNPYRNTPDVHVSCSSSDRPIAAGEALPESPAPMQGHDGIERTNHFGVSFGCQYWPFLVRRPRQASNLTSAHNRQSGLHQLPDYLASGRRRQNFRFKTFLIAAFSSARSAYMRLSLAFSASSSRNRVSSDTSTPEYLLFHW